MYNNGIPSSPIEKPLINPIFAFLAILICTSRESPFPSIEKPLVNIIFAFLASLVFTTKESPPQPSRNKPRICVYSKFGVCSRGISPIHRGAPYKPRISKFFLFSNQKKDSLRTNLSSKTILFQK